MIRKCFWKCDYFIAKISGIYLMVILEFVIIFADCCFNIGSYYDFFQ